MKNKGFTLIELLAVIVVLAVIAIIAIPIITSVIDKAKVGALKDSAYGIIEAGELYLAKNMSEGINDTIEFTCSNGACLSGEKKITYKGQIDEGTLILTPDSKTLVCVDNGKNYALKLVNEKEVNTGIGTCGSYEEENGTFNIIEATSARIEALESELNKYENVVKDLKVNWNFYSTGAPQTFKVPKSGTYKIELWGAGTVLGGYVAGNINLEKDTELYIYVGGYTGTNLGGYNGGGNSNYTSVQRFDGGGGSTDVRLVGGDWNNFDSLKSRIMVASGASLSCPGGGLLGNRCPGSSTYVNHFGYGGTQTKGGQVPTKFSTAQNGQAGGFGYGGYSGYAINSGGSAGAGSGYYGGSGASGAHTDGWIGGSGSSFISGHEGCNAIAENSTSTNIIHTGQANHYSNYVFTDTIMIDGNGYSWTTEKGTEIVGVPNYNGDGIMTSSLYNGFAKITLINLD